MTDHSITADGNLGPVAHDDPARSLTVAAPDDAAIPHLCVVGDTYSVLVQGKQTEGRYCLIDMLVPPGSGPPPHRHDFEELFILLEGELEFTFRGETQRIGAGSVVNIPARAPHRFTNASGGTAHMLCMCTPAGQEEFFMAVGDRVKGRSSPCPKLSDEEQAQRGKKAKELAPKYRTEML